MNNPTDNTQTTEKIVDHSARGHAVLGGSKASIWQQCPGSVFLLKGMPPTTPTPEMERGTFVHEVCEVILEDFLKYKMYGTDPDARRSQFAHDPEALASADAYVEYIYTQVLEGSISNKAWGIEDVFYLDEHLEMYGPSDFWAVYIDDKGKRVLDVTDYKNGTYPVNAENNPQIAFYLCCTRKFLQENGKDIDYAYGRIFQSNSRNEDLLYSEHKFTAKQLDTWEKKFFKAAEQIFIKKKPRYKTGDHCFFCRAKVLCTKFQKQKGVQDALVVINPKNTEFPDVSKLPPEMLKTILEKEDSVKKLFSDIRTYITDTIKNNGSFPGFKIVRSKGRRKLMDEMEIVQATLEQHGLTENDIYEKKPLGVTKLEAALAAKTKMKKKEAKEIITGLCTLSEGVLSLVSDNDPRESVSTESLGGLNIINYNY